MAAERTLVPVDLEAEYHTLDRKRAAQLGQVTRIHNSVKQFDPRVNSIHVLKNHRECIAAVQRSHEALIDEMMEHPNADHDVLPDVVDAFRVAHTTAVILIDEMTEKSQTGSKADVLMDLNNEMTAIHLGLDEFKAIATDSYAECSSSSELRLRLRDIQSLHTEYLATFKKIFVLADEEHQNDLTAERRSLNSEFYKTMSWFDSKVNSVTPQETQKSSSSATVKLPRIELQTFDGTPDTWISFRDSFKSLVHSVQSLSGAIKFRYLKSSIKDKFSPIQHLIETDDGYETAWQTVLEYYDDKRRIVDCHISGMLKVRSMEAESHDELQRVLNEFSLHIASLERMHNEEELYRAFIAHLVIQRLDSHTRDLWETENKGQVPFWPDLQRFLKERRKTLSTMPTPKPPQSRNFSNHGSRSNGKSAATHTATKLSTPAAIEAQSAVKGKPSKCHLCSGDHRLHLCQQFLQFSIPQRLSKVKDWKICSNCFGSHALNTCTSPFRCRSCKQSHHTMLHLESSQPSQTSSHSLQASSSSLQPDAMPFLFPTSSCNTSSRRGQVTLLQTAIVQVEDALGEWQSVRAFLDSGSDSNYISTSAARALNLPFLPTYIEANGLGGKRAAVIRHKIKTRIGNYVENLNMELLVTSKVTNPTPIVSVASQSLEIPPNLPLADPTFNVPGKIDILIGNEHYGDLIRDGRLKLPSGPTMLNTVFGWIFSGSVPLASPSPRKITENRVVHHISTQVNHNTLSELKESVEKFYKLEDYRTEKRFLTDEEAHCEKVFEQTPRTESGRFKIFLPLKENINQLINNYRRALILFFVLEKRLMKNENLRIAYVKFMKEFIDLGHMTEIDISNESPEASAFYFPHHGVENPDSSTTKLRVVFNGSSNTRSGISFNDAQCVGPQIQSDVFSLSLRFRRFPVVIKADIEKMYRQVEVAEQQRKYQRIIWRDNPDMPLKVYSLNTVTYGTASASFQATRCLKELAIIHREKFPQAAEEILNSFYVDDYITGASSVLEATTIALKVIEILGSAQMKLRKFNSNNSEFLRSIPEELREESKDDEPIKALGIKWDPITDTIGIDVKPIKYEKITRRSMLSELHRPYDPNGLIGPVTFRFKLFLKRIFKLSMPWDSPVPDKDAEDWTELASQFPALSQVRIARCVVLPNYVDVQLHGFCDASDEGYGIAIYLRSREANSRIMTQLLCSKSRVAPNEYRSTARLELCGAVMLANMMQQVAKAMNLPFSKRICWSDSAIALQWLKKSPALLQTFVANRVSEIQELSFNLIWRHIRGAINPADLISRGLTPNDIINCPLWWHGPDFLAHTESKWPVSIVEVDPTEPAFKQEFKKIESLVHATSTVQPHQDINPFLEWIEGASRTWTVKRKIAPIMRFIYNTRAKKNNKQLRSGPFQVDDMVDSELALARIYQAHHFRDEFRRCASGKAVAANSSLKNLDPIWDSHHRLMRVGGRLNHAQQCSEAQKHPVILPHCHFSRLIIRESHQQNLHAGQNATLGFVRLRYWPLRSKHIVRQEVHRCIRCFRARPRMVQQLMGQLPAQRTTPSPPFFHTGVDYCGPFDINVSSQTKILFYNFM